MKLKTWVIILGLTLGMVSQSFSWGDDGKQKYKIAVIQDTRLIEEFKGYQQAQKAIANAKDNVEKKMKALRDQAQAKVDKIQKKLVIANKQKDKERTEELNELLNLTQKDFEKSKSLLNKKLKEFKDKKNKEVKDKIMSEVKKYSDEHKIDFVFYENSFLYTQPAHDITDKVLKILNK